MNTTFKRINASLWMENNCAQCWNCANIEGSDIFLHDGKYIRLPECRVADRYITEVYHNPCNSYIPFGGN